MEVDDLLQRLAGAEDYASKSQAAVSSLTYRAQVGEGLGRVEGVVPKPEAEDCPPRVTGCKEA